VLRSSRSSGVPVKPTNVALGNASRGHYTLLPPSRHPLGDLYRWIIPLPPIGAPLPQLPDSLIGAGTPSNRYSGCTKGTPSGDLGFIQGAIARTMPTGPAQRNHNLFDLVLALKFSGITFSDNDLQDIVRQWLNGAIQAGTKDRDFFQTWKEFRYGWERATGGILTTAKAAARGVGGSLQDRLLALCETLAGAERCFFLSYGDAAEATDCTKRGAYKAMMQLREAGRLVLVKAGEAKLGGLATEWRLP
jgi:hypothetical protein